MADMMTFPDTVEEFMEQYKIVDTEGIYISKGSELVPIFRMKQWFEHKEERKTGKWIDVACPNCGCNIHIEPEPKKGHWVGIDDEPCDDWECDVCGEIVTDCGYDVLPNFCPNCGADMRGGEE